MTCVLLAIVGCSGTERSVLTDVGSVCLSSTASGGLSVRVEFPGCLSSSCDREISARCDVSRSGSELRIESESVVESKTGTRDCTDDCRIVVTTCVLEPVEAGEYRVVHGRDEGSVRLPAVGVLLFADSASCTAPMAAPPSMGGAGQLL
jgi:hypothetical protein